jgi:hypothetical protein
MNVDAALNKMREPPESATIIRAANMAYYYAELSKEERTRQRFEILLDAIATTFLLNTEDARALTEFAIAEAEGWIGSRHAAD